MSVIARIQILVDKLAFAAPLLARLCLGVNFTLTGWGKLHSLDNLIDFFKQLGIPLPQLQAPFVAGLEFFGGIAILVGLLTRISSALLGCTMIVAILTAKLADIHDLGDLVGTQEFMFLAMFAWLALAGAGPLSLDHLLFRRKR